MPAKYMNATTRIPEIITRHESQILAEWLAELRAGRHQRNDLQNETDLHAQCLRLLALIRTSMQASGLDVTTDGWEDLRQMLTDISRTRAKQGFTASATASFVFSLKKPIFHYLRVECKTVEELANETWSATELIDSLGLLTSDLFQKSREEVIIRQQQDLLELSTPVVKLWDGILALPLIGTLDSTRTQVVMESLLTRIVETGCEVAIIDITGVATVDTLVAQHLIKTVTAARLMGADCIISGIRPQIAQTIVHLGVNLEDVVTKATLADAFVVALKRTGSSITRPQHAH